MSSLSNTTLRVVRKCGATLRVVKTQDAARNSLRALPGMALGNSFSRLGESRHSARHGSILLVVLGVIALMTIGGMAYFDWTFIEHQATQMYGRQLQTRAAADSGIELIKSQLLEDPEIIEQSGGLYNNPSWFRGVMVTDSDTPALRLRVAMLAPLENYGDFVGCRFGLENESARINLNTLLLADDYAEEGARLQLMALPGMTESIADAILDWLDEDDELRDYGAEAEHYATLETPYPPQNGPLESIDQLLLVRGVTPNLLYGLDQNRNFVLDGAEAAGVLSAEVDNTDGSMNRGWAAFLTLYSAEANLTPEGEAKIDVNMEDLEELHTLLEDALGTEQANFIVAYRQGGAAEDSPDVTPMSAATVTMDFNQEGSETISSLLSLVGVNVEFSDAGAPAVLQTPFPDDASAMYSYLPDLLDNLTVTSTETHPGRLNVNQAPRTLLYSVPNMPPEVVEQIIASRSFEVTPDRPERRHAEWLMLDGLLDLEQMQAIAPLVTGGGDVYRAQVVGYYEAEGPISRVEVVIDGSEVIPQVLHKIDLTPLGAGFSLEELTGAETPEESSR